MFKDNVESQTHDTIGSEVLNQGKSDAKVDNEWHRFQNGVHLVCLN